jgi:hypothetical protein
MPSVAFPRRALLHGSPGRQDAEAPLAAAVRPSVRTVFPSTCGQLLRSKHCRLLGLSRRGLPRQRHGAALAGAASRWRSAVAGGRGARPRQCPRDTWARRRQRTSLHSAEAAGSFGRVGRGPTPPSSTAPPSHTPPRRCLRGVQATPGSRTSGRQCTPVCPAARGLVSAAVKTAPPLDCPHARLGCQATFRPPVGTATRSNGCCALPYLHAPHGAQEGRHRHRCALPVPLGPATPLPPREGAPAIAFAPACMRLCRSCRLRVTALPSRARLPPKAGDVARHSAQDCSACVWLSAVFLPPCNARTVLPPGSCVKVRPSRPRCWRTAGAGPVRAGGQTTHTRAGRDTGEGWRAAWGQRAPTPLVRRCAPRVGRAVLH